MLVSSGKYKIWLLRRERMGICESNENLFSYWNPLNAGGPGLLLCQCFGEDILHQTRGNQSF